MFKIEYLFSDNLSFRVGYCVFIEIPLRLSPSLTFRNRNLNMNSDVTFFYAYLNLCIKND